MDAPCKIQRSIHVFRLVNNMCPGKWVHIMNWGLFIGIALFLRPIHENYIFTNIKYTYEEDSRKGSLLRM